MFILAIQYRCNRIKHYYEEDLSDALDLLEDEYHRDDIVNANIIDIQSLEHHFYDEDIRRISTIKIKKLLAN